MNDRPYCISVDWLQTYNIGNYITPGTYYSTNETFKVKLEQGETAVYKEILSVWRANQKIATILQCPRNSVMNKKAISIKLENRVLYSKIYVYLLYEINEALRITYKGLTRLDICYDCNELYDGRNVHEFIEQFVSSKPGEIGHIIRRRSNKFVLHGEKSPKKGNIYNSIRWGSLSSKKGAYCYNKSLELIEVKDKPWIRETWKENGLIHKVQYKELEELTERKKTKKTNESTLSEYIVTPVWRFEISIKCQGMDVLDMSSGWLFKLSPEYLRLQENVEDLFFCYANDVFDFRINTGQKNVRNYHRMQLFCKKEKVSMRPYYISKCADTGRMEKVCYNKIKKLSEEYTDLSEQCRASLINTMVFLRELSGWKSGRIKLLKLSNSLNSLKGNKFLTDESRAYFMGLRFMCEYRKDFNADEFYRAMFECPPITEELFNKLYDSAPPINPFETSYLG